MPRFELPVYPKKYPVPGYVKLIVLVLVILGLSIRGCWYKKVDHSVLISNVYLSDTTNVTTDVNFTVENQLDFEMEQNLLITVNTDKNYPIATKIVKIKIPKKTKLDYLKVINKFERPLSKEEHFGTPTVILYKPSFLSK